MHGESVAKPRSPAFTVGEEKESETLLHKGSDEEKPSRGKEAVEKSHWVWVDNWSHEAHHLEQQGSSRRGPRKASVECCFCPQNVPFPEAKNSSAGCYILGFFLPLGCSKGEIQGGWGQEIDLFFFGKPGSNEAVD